MALTVWVAPHPLLELGAFVSRFARPLGEVAGRDPGVAGPMTADDAVRTEIRRLLRHGGFKPRPAGLATRRFGGGTSTGDDGADLQTPRAERRATGSPW